MRDLPNAPQDGSDDAWSQCTITGLKAEPGWSDCGAEPGEDG